jgi:Kelch motif
MLTGQIPAGDFPSVRHVARNYAYSRSNHMLMMMGGYHQNITFDDSWFLCLAVGGKCTSDLVAAGWQLMTTPHVLDGADGGRQEVTTVYDDTNNAFFLFAGLHDPNFGNPGLWVNCPVANAPIGCPAANDWFRVTTTCTGANCTTPVRGNSGPVWQHGTEMRYMPDSGKIIMFGGSTSGGATPAGDVWIYNAATKAWTQGTSYPGALGNSTLSATFWPSFAYDTDAHLGVLYAGPGLLYTYNPTTAIWTLTNVPGGPVLDTVNQGEPSRNLEYNATSQTLVFVQQGGLNGTTANQPDTWELPESTYAIPSSFSVRLSARSK